MNKKTLIILGLTTIFLLYPFLTYGSEIKYSNSKDITPDLHTVHMDMEGNFKALFINNLGEDIEITGFDIRNTVSKTSCVGNTSSTSVPAGGNFTINAVGCAGEHEAEPESTYRLEISVHYLSNSVQNTETSILEGEYEKEEGGEIVLLLMLGLALLLAKLFGEAFERIGQPSVIGEILVGVVIGHQVLGPWLGIDVGGHVFHAFATVGIMLLLFLSGLEVELKKLKETGKLAVFVAIGGVLLPFAGGYAIGMWQFNDTYVAMLLGAILTATSVGVTARILMEAKVLDTKAGSTIIGAAVIDDILGILVIVVVSSIALTGGVSFEALGLLSLKMLVFFFLTVVVGLMVINRLTNLFEKMGTAKAFIALSLTMVFLFGVFAESVQIAAITGAFIAGMLIGETPFRRRAIEEVETIGYGFFIPLFFVWVGTWIDFEAFAGLALIFTDFNAFMGSTVMLMIMLIVVALLSKLIGCGLPAKLMGCSTKEATLIGVGMIPRLEIGLVVAAIGISAGMAGEATGQLAMEVSALAVVISIATGVIPLFFLRSLIEGYMKESKS